MPAPRAHRGANNPGDLSPEAEAFRQELSSQHGSGSSSFANWKRSQTPRRLFALFLGLSLMAPGLICFVLDAPWTVSIGLELAGAAANWWLRRERRRHLQAIVGWDED